VRKYGSLDDVLNDGKVQLVVNLTNPRSHFAVSSACLAAGKHVYSEKPLAMSFSEGQQLVELARSNNRLIASAPCRVLAETAQTMWKALREEVIGDVRAVYVEMDCGLLCRLPYKEWINEFGIPWPYKDEFAVGCTIEHAGYAVSWLTAFFGPIDTVTAFGTCQIQDLKTECDLDRLPPDLTVACLKFKSGLVARLTSSWIAPRDNSLRIFGDTGILSTANISSPGSPVYVSRYKSIKIGSKRIVGIPRKQRYPLIKPSRESSVIKVCRIVAQSPRQTTRAIRARFFHLRKRVDFCIGPAELASAICDQRPCRLAPEYCLHTTEVVLAIHNSIETGSNYKVQTSFAAMKPMPWACRSHARTTLLRPLMQQVPARQPN
jgi:predicted dehydrogenase